MRGAIGVRRQEVWAGGDLSDSLEKRRAAINGGTMAGSLQTATSDRPMTTAARRAVGGGVRLRAGAGPPQIWKLSPQPQRPFSLGLRKVNPSRSGVRS